MCSSRLTRSFILLLLLIVSKSIWSQTANEPALVVSAKATDVSAGSSSDTEQPKMEQTIPVSEKPTMTAPKKQWNQWENRAFTFGIYLAGLADISAVVQDKTNKAQVGGVPLKTAWRAERLMFAGALKFKTPWSYILGANFNGIDAPVGERFTWMDVRLDIPVPAIGKAKIGRQKVGVSQEWMMPGMDGIFMERSLMNNAFIPQRNVGVFVQNTFARDRGAWSAGWFNDWFINHRGFSENGNQYSGRISFLPIANDEKAAFTQVATAFLYKQPIQGNLRFKTRPELNESPEFADTGNIPSNYATVIQFESMSIRGPLQFFGEFSVTPVSAPTKGDPLFYGGYVGLSYLVTGEHRGFNRKEGYFTRFVPRSPFSFRNPGPGAWELAGRYSMVDLTSGSISGGKAYRWTPAVISWYPTSQWRVEFNYGWELLDRFGTLGSSHGFSARLQWGQ